jgi:eukaryotic-like serine/threonine-protein kinase
MSCPVGNLWQIMAPHAGALEIAAEQRGMAMPGIDGANWETVSALLDELLDLDDAQRAARLSRLRRENPALGEQVAELLGHHEAARLEQFLDGAVADSLGIADLAGRTFGGYTLERPLGHGGMGSVWLARRSDGRYEGYAAVKLLNLGSLGSKGAERLRHEASALAKLSHPNITHIIDAGVAAGQPYLILEYVEGEPIDRWCDMQRLGIAARLRLFLQVLAAVSHAHGRLILHRDLKPSNILVTKDGTAKLLDFGIAKLLEGKGQPASQGELTKLGGAMTPEYAAPEQLLHAEVTTATDVYALGVLLYVLLVGKHPTASATGTPVDQMQALVETEPERPSDAATGGYAEVAHLRGTSPQHLGRVLRGDLDNILAKALKKEPTQRYATADAFASDLQHFLNHEPVSARADSRMYRMRKFVRRHRVGVAAATSIALLLVAGISGTTWQAIEARRQRAEATAQARESARQRDVARFQAQRAEASSEFMSLMLEEVGPGGRPLTPVELVDRGVQLLDRRYGEDPQFAARMLLQMARRYMDLGSTEKQAQVVARALTIAQAQNNPDLLADVECVIVRTETDAGRYDAAERHMQSARAALGRVAAASVETRVDCLRAEAEIADARHETESAIGHLKTAQRLLEEADDTRGLRYHAVLTDLGGLYFKTSRFRETLEMNERTAAALDRNGRGGTLGRVTIAMNHASILLRLGEVLRAEAASIDAMRRSQRLDDDKPTVPIYVVSYSIILNRLGKTDESIARLRTASRDLHAAGNASWAINADYHLARALMLAGNHDESLKLLDEVRRAWAQNPTVHKDRLADLQRTLAEIDLARGRLKQAQELIDSSLQQFGYPSAQHPLNLTAALTTAARIYSALGRHAEAESFAMAALRISEGIARAPSESADVGDALFALAHVRRAQGKTLQARTDVDRAVQALTNGLGRDHPATREAIALRRALLQVGRQPDVPVGQASA